MMSVPSPRDYPRTTVWVVLWAAIIGILSGASGSGGEAIAALVLGS